MVFKNLENFLNFAKKMESIDMHIINYLLCYATKTNDPLVYLPLERLNSIESMDASQTTKILKRLVFLVEIKSDSKMIDFVKKFLGHTQIFEEILKNEKTLKKFLNYVDSDEKYLLLNHFLVEFKKKFSKSYHCKLVGNLNKYVMFCNKKLNEIKEWKIHFCLHILSLAFHKNIQNTVWAFEKNKENILLDAKTYYEEISEKYVFINNYLLNLIIFLEYKFFR